MSENEEQDFSSYSGVEKAAILLLAINDKNASEVFKLLSEDEIKEISRSMAYLGSVQQDVIDRLIFEFSGEISSAVSVGNHETTEKLLLSVLGSERANTIMDEIRGPVGKNTWDKLGNVNEDTLAAYLKNEYPQTVALIASKLNPSHAAKLFSVLPEEFTLEVIQRMLSMESVKKEVLDGVEKTLRAEFISTFSKTAKYDANELMAEIFNNFDRVTEAKFMGKLEELVPEVAEKVKSLMFTFDDLIKLDGAAVQAVLRNVDKGKLTIALKGASQPVRDLFLSNMSQRAAKIVQEDMEAMGPVRLRDVDEAQTEIVLTTKSMAAKGEIEISDSDGQDEFVE